MIRKSFLSKTLPARALALVGLTALMVSSPLLAPPFTLEGPGVNPDDFRVTVFASGLDFPLGMAELSDGSILVTISEGTSFFNSTGKLIRLVDTDGDGVADGPAEVLYEGLPGAQTAVCVAGGLVFVTSAGKPLTILRAGEAASDPLTLVGRILFNYPDAGSYHAHSALEIRETPGVPDSYDLFFQLGSEHNFAESTRLVGIESSDIAGVGGTLVGGSAYMMTIAGEGGSLRMTGLTRIAAGLRNAAGFALHPTEGDLYFQDNGIDGLVDVNEPHSADEINFIARTDIGRVSLPHFGFPDNYTAYRTGEVVGGEGVQPLLAFQPIPDPSTGLRSEGPNDIAVAPPGFPSGLNGGLFIGFHGKFNAGGLANDENPVVYADPKTGEYFHFILGQQEGIGHLDGLLATRDSLFLADLVTGGQVSNGAGQGVIYQIQALTPPTPPKLALERLDSAIELRWDRGNVQQADEAAGPWEDLDGIFSPHLVEPTGSRKFFRARY